LNFIIKYVILRKDIIVFWFNQLSLCFIPLLIIQKGDIMTQNKKRTKKNLMGLPKGIQTEAQLWDEIFKSMAFFMPNQLFPLIKEIFGIEYPAGSTIELIQTEYSVPDAKHTIKTLRTDLTFRIHIPGCSVSPIYHLECQTKNDSTMSIRLFEYDVTIAVSQIKRSSISLAEANTQHIYFPHTAVLYLQHTKNTPDFQTCQIHFPNGQTVSYQAPVMKVQLYHLDDIHKKHLNFLIPFLPLRFRNRLDAVSEKQKLTMKELTAFLEQIILIIEDETLHQLLSQYEATKLVDLLNKAINRVFYKHDDYRKEALTMTAPILTFEIDKWMDLAEQRLNENKKLLNRNKQIQIENRQIQAEKEKIQAEKEKMEAITKLALKGYHPEEIAAKLNIPLSVILELEKS